MKRHLILVLALVVFSITTKTNSQVSPKPYFSRDELPKYWYVEAPKDGSEEYLSDVKRFFAGRSEMLNNPERAAIATRDAGYEYLDIVFRFSGAFGMKLSTRDTPEICGLLKNALATSDSIHTTKRTTPNKTFGDERGLCKPGVATYPSIHALHGWLTTLLLMEVNPGASDSLLSRGLTFCESAVLRGEAWQSDVDAGRLAASMLYARLHSNTRFIDQMTNAKNEFNNLVDKTSPVVDSIYNDSVYIARRKERANMKLLENNYQVSVQMYTIGFDSITGLKMVYLNNDREYKNIPNAVSHVVFIDSENKVKYVLRSIIRHVLDNDEKDCYGVYVVGRNEQGEIPIGENQYYELRRMLFHNMHGLENCTNINSRVLDSSGMIPFSPATEKNKEKYKYFFCNEKQQQNNFMTRKLPRGVE